MKFSTTKICLKIYIVAIILANSFFQPKFYKPISLSKKRQQLLNAVEFLKNLKKLDEGVEKIERRACQERSRGNITLGLKNHKKYTELNNC